MIINKIECKCPKCDYTFAVKPDYWCRKSKSNDIVAGFECPKCKRVEVSMMICVRTKKEN